MFKRGAEGDTETRPRCASFQVVNLQGLRMSVLCTGNPSKRLLLQGFGRCSAGSGGALFSSRCPRRPSSGLLWLLDWLCCFSLAFRPLGFSFGFGSFWLFWASWFQKLRNSETQKPLLLASSGMKRLMRPPGIDVELKTNGSVGEARRESLGDRRESFRGKAQGIPRDSVCASDES